MTPPTSFAEQALGAIDLVPEMTGVISAVTTQMVALVPVGIGILVVLSIPRIVRRLFGASFNIANSMRNGLDRAAPETAEQAVSGVLDATDETDFKLIRYTINHNTRAGKLAHLHIIRGLVSRGGLLCTQKPL